MEENTEFVQNFFRKAKKYIWKPQPDIDIHELAQCIPGAALGHIPNPNIEKYVENLPPECRRHFKEVKDE